MKLLYALSALAGFAAAAPELRQTSSPCEQISASKQQRVPASLALACLRSVPNKKQPALKLLESLRAYASWQSTLAWLKEPPASYTFPAVDVLAELDNMAADVRDGRYSNEYDFQLDLYKLVISAHDGHFVFLGDIFRPFNFENKLAARILSLSSDGVQVPRLYPYSALAAGAGDNPVAITQINGQNATDFILQQNEQWSSYQDPDSQWNSMFASVTKPQSYLTIASSPIYQGDSVTITYENGTKQTESTSAAIYADLSGITDGEDFYERFCSGKNSANSQRIQEPASSVEKRQALGFPAAVVENSEDSISGYFLSGKGYEDVAVLAVRSFSTTGGDPVKYLNEYQRTISSFLERCRAAGKQRLVVDLSANGGGYVVAGYELFAQIFPDLEQFGATNIRRAESFVSIANVIKELGPVYKPQTMAQQVALQTITSSTILSNVIPNGVEKPDGEQFTSIDDILDPVTLRGDEFTAYQNTPLDAGLPGFNVTGAPGQPKPPPAVFKPENVMLLTDGTCGSTCTIFSYLMTIQANVKSTAMGGRPKTGPMQSIAGVKGSQVFLFTDIRRTADAAIRLADEKLQEELRAGELGVLAEGYLISRATDSANAGGVNGKNSFLPGDASTPAQFLYQPANCRFFYTGPMLGDARLVWQRAVDATWTAPDRFCVAGSQVPVNVSAHFVDGAFSDDDDAAIAADLGPDPTPSKAKQGMASGGAHWGSWQFPTFVTALAVLLAQL